MISTNLGVQANAGPSMVTAPELQHAVQHNDASMLVVQQCCQAGITNLIHVQVSMHAQLFSPTCLPPGCMRRMLARAT